jgi:hypothetical protein
MGDCDMKGNEQIKILISKINKHIQLLDGIKDELNDAYEKDIKILGKTNRSATMVAGIIESYYTCAETIFMRVSQFFENDLPANRWHTELLERMTIEIEHIRPALLSQSSYEDLQELMRFRHFKRYYFTFAFDWERVDEMSRRLFRVHPLLLKEIGAFQNFLEKLLEE